MTGLRSWLHAATERNYRLSSHVVAESPTGWTISDAALAYALLDAVIALTDNAVLQNRDLPATILSAALDDIYTRSARDLTAPHPQDTP